MSAPARERVGLLGGSFDPPHEGHLWLARRARALWQLDAVWLLPAYQPPHKTPTAVSPYPQRAAMARLLAAAEPWLRLEDIEAERGGPSYTLDTVRALKARDGARCHFFLILGADALAELHSWREPAQLCAEIELLVVARPGETPAAAWPHRLGSGETHPAQSRTIRAAIAAGRPAPWLPPAVAAYIERAGLYRPQEAG
ncbi:nicotinate (nicotinamide) nucleotide adenylyltransferase [bacterium]|nr:nicotinate (nicotinamide) nucleotide adenylyltransferase [bacterium]